MKTIKFVDVFLIVVLITLSSFIYSFRSVSKEIIELNNIREIFIDNYLIEKFKGTQLVMHTPKDEGAVMYFDKPWEGIFSFYTTIIKDGDLFRAYYRGRTGDLNSQVTCYAESYDGINWQKPEIGLYEMNGSTKNNIILENDNYSAGATSNFTPFLDSNPDTKFDQKYKALGGNKSEIGLVAYVSSDGIYWNKLQDDSVIKKGAFDSQNVSFWSESEKLYICYLRIYNKEGFRSVSRTTSKDFINWSEPLEMNYSNTLSEHLYTQQTSPYYRAPHIYLAIGARFMPKRQVLTEEQALKIGVHPNFIKDISDAYFMTTRGGNFYDRTFMESFIRPGIGLNNWTSRTNYPALNVVQTSDTEMSIYVNENYAQPTAHLQRYSIRIDGFTSINAPYKGGFVITRPFIFSGKELEINYSTSAAGEIRIEIQNENGNPIPGFTMEEAQILIGNEIERIVSWSGNKKLAELAGKPIRLHFFMKDADLYSLRFK